MIYALDVLKACMMVIGLQARDWWQHVSQVLTSGEWCSVNSVVISNG